MKQVSQCQARSRESRGARVSLSFPRLLTQEAPGGREGGRGSLPGQLRPPAFPGEVEGRLGAEGSLGVGRGQGAVDPQMGGRRRPRQRGPGTPAARGPWGRPCRGVRGEHTSRPTVCTRCPE